MKVTMAVALTGSVNGVPYPSAGGVLDTTDDHGAELCARGLATPVVEPARVERATQPTAEQRTVKRAPRAK